MEHVTDECQCEGKICKDCQKLLCIGCYKPHGKNNPTLKPRCRSCDNEFKYAWARANPEKVKMSQKKYCSIHGYQVNAHGRQLRIKNAKKWNQAHPEEMKEYRRAYRMNNPEKVKNGRETWFGEHPEKLQEYAIKYGSDYRREVYIRYKQNMPDAYRARNKTRRINRRARKRKAQGTFTNREWLTLKAKYDHRCLCCGKQEPEIKLTVDHIIPLSQGGSNAIDNIQPLCWPCNRKKGTRTIDFRPKNT